MQKYHEPAYYFSKVNNFTDVDTKISFFNEQLKKYAALRALVNSMQDFVDFHYLQESNVIEGEEASLNITKMPPYLKDKSPDFILQFIAYMTSLGREIPGIKSKPMHYKQALDFIKTQAEADKAAEELPPVAAKFITNMHTVMFKGTPLHYAAGHYRTDDRQLPGKNKLWTPPHPAEISGLVNNLVNNINDSWKKNHPIVQAAKTQCELVRIQPFADGNDRVGRFMANYMLLRNSYPCATINGTTREEYHAALDKGIDTGDVSDVASLLTHGLNKRYEEYVKAYNEFLKTKDDPTGTITVRLMEADTTQIPLTPPAEYKKPDKSFFPDPPKSPNNNGRGGKNN